MLAGVLVISALPADHRAHCSIVSGKVGQEGRCWEYLSVHDTLQGQATTINLGSCVVRLQIRESQSGVHCAGFILLSCYLGGSPTLL